MSEYPTVGVLWNDAHSDLDTHTPKSAAKSKGELTYSVGQLIAESDEGVQLCMDTWPDHPRHGGKIGGFIPWESIIEYWDYE